MGTPEPAEVDAAITRAMREAAAQPVVIDLGTPDIAPFGALQDLAALGPGALQPLLERLREAPAREAAYLVKAIGMIGDASAVGPLQEVADAYASKTEKGPWDFAVLGQARSAMLELGEGTT